MKYLIEITFVSGGEVQDSRMVVWAEDARYALMLVQTEIDMLSAKVCSITPIQETEGAK